MNEMRLTSREIELDLLRVLACFAVIMVHICGMKTHVLPLSDRNWAHLTFIAALQTWQVPVFVMISGRFFLEPTKERPLLVIWKRYIWRLVLAFIVWNVVYQISFLLLGQYDSLNWKGIIMQVLEGPYHFWYLFMMIGLYMIVPFLQRITASKQLSEYFIILFLIFAFLTKYGTEIPVIGTYLSSVLTKSNFYFALGYSGYFVLGYYLWKYPVSDKYEIPLYILGLILIIVAAAGTTAKSVWIGEHKDWFSQYLTPNVAIDSTAVYTFFIKRVSRFQFTERASNIIVMLSTYSFGVFLVHALVIEGINLLHLSPIMASPFFTVPVLAILVFVISNIIVALVRKIPSLGRKIT